MATPTQRIALISVHGDPAIDIGKEEAGGQNVYVRQVGEALGNLGWQVDMFTRQTGSQPAIVEHSKTCRTIRLTAGPEDFVPRDEIFDYLPEFVDAMLAFQGKEGVRYPIVHTNYWLSAWVGMTWKQRQKALAQVHTYHSLGAVKYRAVEDIPPIGDTRLETEKRVLETAERTVATSPQEEADMRSLLSSEGDVVVIPCGTDVERFGQASRQEARRQLGISPETKLVFYIGRFDRRKGIETLVRAIGQSAFREDPQLQLVIGGGSRPGRSDGIERDRIEGIVAELSLEGCTTFPGRISDDDLPLYYAAANACVVPSHYEPFGLVAIEAMASGTPVVASEVGGLQYTVKSEETGLLAPPKDAAAFSSAIDRILEDETWRDRLGEAARRRVEEHFSWRGVARQLDRLYQEVLSSSGAAAPRA